ncbi:MAG: LysM peptidoglycan-binding domain-containing protein, partial [Desulfosalsimonadaceae bacterium]|nr:LysM peptidoglycan-binding domain-containing protein [Desulfosalsimonadaceae bacterium]
MIVKNSSRNATFVRVFIFCLLLMPCVAGAAIEDHITRTETGFYYTIQKGDTLWDLSRQFSDSSWVWPDLWSQNNPQILNPHRIYPGQKILVYKKGWEGAEKHAIAATPAPAAKPSEPVKKDAAPSHIFTKIDRVGFIRQTETPHHGTIFKSKDDLSLIDKGAMVYIYPEPGAPPLTVGGKYTIFRTFDRITDPETKNDIGVQHLLTGVVEITAVEPEFAIGDIVDCYRDIQINDRIMPYMQRNADIPIRQGVEGLSGRVIKPEAEDEVLIGENAL